MLLYGDESEALTHPYLARAWAQRGADLRVPAPGQAKKIAMMGALDWTTRQLIVTTSRTKRSTDFITLLQTPDDLYGPRPGLTMKPVVIVLDNGPIHTSKAQRRRSRRGRIGSPSSGCPSTRLNSTTSRSSGTTSKRVTSLIRPSRAWKPSTLQ